MNSYSPDNDKVKTLREFLAWRPPDLINLIEDGILTPQGTMFIVGPSKSWKSMLSNHLGFCLAQGIPWLGLQTTKCSVLIIQIEIVEAAYHKRIVKYTNYIDNPPNNICFKTETQLKIDTGVGLSRLDKIIQQAKNNLDPALPLVVIIDPLYRCLSSNVSDAQDASRAQDNLIQMSSKHSCAIVLVHHTRLTQVCDSGPVNLGAEELMGSSYWNNWCDSMLMVRRLDPEVETLVGINFEYTRHAEHRPPRWKIRWQRKDLRPKILETVIYSDDEEEDEIEITTRDLLGDSNEHI
jgi:hypothetical protein